MKRLLEQAKAAAAIVAAVAAIATVGMAAAAPAHAYTAQQVGELLERGGRSIPGVGCGTACENWYVQEHRPYPNSPASRDLHRELAAARRKVGLLPRLSSFGTRTIPALTSLMIGWEIGTLAGPLFGISPQFNNRHTSNATIYYRHTDQYNGPPSGGDLLVRAPVWQVMMEGGSPIPAVRVGTTEQCGEYGAGEGAQTEINAVLGLAGFTTRRFSPGDHGEGCSQGADAIQAWRGIAGGGDSPYRETLPAGVTSSYTPTCCAGSTDYANPSPPSSEQQLTDRVQAEVMNQPDLYPRLHQWLGHQETPETVQDPTAVDVIQMPDCIGLSYNACITVLQNAGFGVFQRSARPFETAEPMPQAQPEQVLTTDPAPGEQTTATQPVVVDTNPPRADMPFLMPDLRGKTHSEAEDLMAPFGWPAPEPTVNTEPDYGYGPDQVTGQQPAPGSREHVDQPAPGSSVQVNPTTAPNWGGSGGSCGLTAPTVAFDASPLTNLNLGDKLPFAFPALLVGMIGPLSGPSAPPEASFTLLGETVDLSYLENFDGVVGILRTLLLVLLWIGAGWFLYGRTIGKDT